jgi:hypothetical protein
MRHLPAARARTSTRPGRTAGATALASVVPALLAVVLAAFVAACGPGPAGIGPVATLSDGTGVVVDLPVSTPPPSDSPPAAGRTPRPTPATDWPTTAPADVPSFPGRLDNLMAGRRSDHGLGVRMFFSSVNRGQFESYIEALRAGGYVVKGVVYYTDSTEAGQLSAQQRAARGDIDSVIARRDPRDLTITVPNDADGLVTFDLDGLTQAENDALNTAAWPAAWAARLPQPHDCKLDSRSIQINSATGLQVYCTYTATDQAARDKVVEDYLDVLAERGFKTIDADSKRYYVKLQDASIQVTIYPDMGGRMQIEAVELPRLTDTGWPADWVDRVPPPDGCVVGPKDVIGHSSTDLNVGCVYPDTDPVHHQQVVDAYVARLVAAGFTVVPTTGPGDPQAINLQKGALRVGLLPGGYPNGLSIGASDGG